MKTSLMAMAAAVALVSTAQVRADEGGSRPTIQVNPAQQFDIPATVQGRATTLSFVLDGFVAGTAANTACAVGTLRSPKGTSGSVKMPPMRVAFPVGNATQADCAGATGDDDDHGGGFGGLGAVERRRDAKPALYTAPWSGTIQKASYNGSAPFIVPAQVCQILNLVLGPIHLNLLGLVVDTNTIRLNITGNPQLGLLGNLLCSLLGP
jgi:hypothetical protein